MLLEEEDELHLSVSVTTRQPRKGEEDGTHYHFVDEEKFHDMADKGAMLEWAKVFGNYYGTPKAEVKTGIKEGKDFLFDIDWQGMQQLHQRAEGDVVRVFILPPSIAELEQRLRDRGTDSEEVIAGRMARARDEISHWDAYDYVVVNDDLATCYQQVRAILRAERMRRSRQTGIVDFVREMME